MGIRWPHPVKWATRDEWDEYYADHAACPECGRTEYEVTTMLFSAPPDWNHVSCLCRWTGRVDDLVTNHTE